LGLSGHLGQFVIGRKIKVAQISSNISGLMPTEKKWRYFERLVAAIHTAADAGAQVKWDDSINGRQFDVTIKFRKGLYGHLTVVECKDTERPVPVEKIDAFVTKASDVHANVAVIASTAGFQSGAIETAKRHNINLIQITPSTDIDVAAFGAEWGDPTDTLHIKEVSLEYVGGERKRLPWRGRRVRRSGRRQGRRGSASAGS